jgi:integrase/recombinase XerD
MRFSHHTLRRIYGRSLYKAGVKIETIAELLRHESIDQTREYLGIRLDDMQAAQERVEVWERNRKNLPPEITVWQR